MMHNLSKTLRDKFHDCSKHDVLITFIITFMVMLMIPLVPGMIFTLGVLVAAFSLLIFKRVGDLIVGGGYPCELFVILRYAFPCSFWPYIFETSLWITIIIFAILISGTVIFICVGAIVMCSKSK